MVGVDSLVGLLPVDEARLARTYADIDLAVPLLVIPLPERLAGDSGKILVIDGYNRIEKAHREGGEALPCFYLTPEQEDIVRICPRRFGRRPVTRSKLMRKFQEKKVTQEEIEALPEEHELGQRAYSRKAKDAALAAIEGSRTYSEIGRDFQVTRERIRQYLALVYYGVMRRRGEPHEQW